MKEINERRSIRRFKNQEIPHDIINHILEAALLSPSGKNRQPWQFVVIKNQQVKNEIAYMLKEKSKNQNNFAIYQATSLAIEEANTIILVMNELENDEVNLLSLGASIENMLLEATHQNIGSLWIHLTDLIEPELKAICHVEHHIISVVALGIPNETPNKRPRKTITEKVKWMK